MRYQGFEEIIDRIKSSREKKRLAVAAAEDSHTLEAVLMASKEGIVAPVLIGDEKKIKSCVRELGMAAPEPEILHIDNLVGAAKKAVEMVRTGQADFVMKGLIETADFMREVVDKETGLRTGSIMSHISFLQIPTYHKIVALTDAALNMYPDLEQKKGIIENAVAALASVGIDNPKVAVLAAIEKVNPKMPETVDADALAHMNERGELKGCVVAGPISYDISMDKEAAEIKGYMNEVAGDADLLVVPNITSGNLLIKSLIYSGRTRSSGFIVGSKAPVILTSRSSPMEDKYLSIVMAASGEWRVKG